MIFYLVPAAAGRPAMLQPTQADANREAKDRGLKVRAPDMEHNVPTDKAGLMGYLNDLLAKDAPAKPAMPLTVETNGGPVTVDLKKLEVDPTVPNLGQHTGQYEVEQDGHPRGPADITSTQVASGITGKSQKVRDVCYVISKMTPAELGPVALELIARGARLGGLTA